MLAITKASLRAISRSPSAIVFSIFFPLIFIVVFGFIGSGGGSVYRLVLHPQSDTANTLVDSLKQIRNIKFITVKDNAELESELIKGRITGVLDIKKEVINNGAEYIVQFKSTTASSDKIFTFLPFLENLISKIDRTRYQNQPTFAQVIPEIRTVRKYRTIDFILPGQLGFSLLSAGVFGVAFLFENLLHQHLNYFLSLLIW